MSPVKIIIVLVAAAAAIGAFMLARTALSDNASASPQPVVVAKKVEEPKVDVLISNRDLRVGEVISQDDLEWVKWPEVSVTLTQITKDAQPDAIQEMAGNIVRIPIFETEPILLQKIVDRGETGIMAALLSPGMRAVSLEISAESASGGFILPNDRVDVLLTYEDEDNREEGETITATIFENVRVLAIDQGTSAPSGATSDIGSTATVELSPENVALMTLAERRGSLSLALRSLSDAALAGDVVTSTLDVFGSSGGGTQSEVVIIRSGQAEATSISVGE